MHCVIITSSYLFTESGVVVALHAALVEGDGNNRLGQSSKEREQGTGH